MPGYRLLLILLFCIPLQSAAQEAFYLGGIQVNEPNHQHWAQSLQQAGMNTVSITVYAKQGDWDSDDLWWEAEEPSVLREIRAAKQAGLQVVLILRIALDEAFARNRFLWHGMVLPKSEVELHSWFEKYADFVEKWAKISAEEGVDLLGVGSEMNALSGTLPLARKAMRRSYRNWFLYHRLYTERLLKFEEEVDQKHLWVRGSDNFPDLETFLDARFEANMAWGRQVYLRGKNRRIARMNERRAQLDGLWRGVIARARAVYDGTLTYAANFDNFHEVGFWDALDIIGINAYFPLRDLPRKAADTTRMRQQFDASWQKVLHAITEFKTTHGLGSKPMMFTELGYTFRRNSTVEPWAHSEFSLIRDRMRDHLVIWREQPVDYLERSLAIDAFRRQVSSMPDLRFSGLLFWKLSTNAQHESIEPFMLHIGPNSQDPLLSVLRRFKGI